MVSKNLDYYAKKFVKLRVDRARGIAPHKPILLLAVIELFAQGKITRNRIYLSPELIATFLKYWSNLGSDTHHSNIALPFFHLTSEKFWFLAPNPGFEATIASRVKIRSLQALQDAVSYAYLDQELFDLLCDAQARDYLMTVLIQTWFTQQSDQVENLYSVDEFEAIQLRLFERGGAVYQVDDLKDSDRAFVRNAAFRRIVVSLYEQRCAFCHLKIISVDNQNIVDGAHIKPFSEFRDDRFENGLALCKNHHWAFDHGWFSISDDYRILIPRDRITEEPPEDAKTMREFHNESIFLPQREAYYPSLEALHWHRNFWDIA
jgi:putative restriction endonuclease